MKETHTQKQECSSPSLQAPLSFYTLVFLATLKPRLSIYDNNTFAQVLVLNTQESASVSTEFNSPFKKSAQEQYITENINYFL